MGMQLEKAEQDECFILVKAQPHRSSKYSETVCCAGIGRDGKWRRQYPVPFRILQSDQKFKRWNWINYSYTTSIRDRRIESQKVLPESLSVSGSVKKSERARFLNPLVRSSFEEANSKNESLTMIRPAQFEIIPFEKTSREIEIERQKHAELANQLSMFDSTARPLKPCPVRFVARWKDMEGNERRHSCDDWETIAAFNRFERNYNRKKAIEDIKYKYEEQYFRAGIVLTFSTHSRRNVTNGTPNQWLLVGVVRLDFDTQGDFLLR